MADQIVVDPSEVQRVVAPPRAQAAPVEVDPGDVTIAPSTESETLWERQPGVALYQMAPGPPQKELPPLMWTDPTRREPIGTTPPKEAGAGKPGGEAKADHGRFDAYSELGKQVGAGYSSGTAAVDHLIANIAGMLESSASALPQFSLGGAELYKHIGNWAREREKTLMQQSAELAGGNQTVPAQVTRGAVSSVLSLPISVAATELGGPVLGMAGLGALESADQGSANMAKGALEQGIMGKFIHVVGPAGRLIRVPLVMGAEYVKNVAQGVDPETALANAMNMG